MPFLLGDGIVPAPWDGFANYGALGLICGILLYTILSERKGQRETTDRILNAVAIALVGVQRQQIIQAFRAKLDMAQNSDECRECKVMLEQCLKSCDEQVAALEKLVK